MFQGLAYFNLGRHTEALECFNSVIDLDPGSRQAVSSHIVKAFIEGNIQEGISYAERYEQNDSGDAEAWYFISFLYGMLGDVDGCVRCLRRAVDGGFFNYPLMSSDKNLDAAREDPEFKKILEKARLKHEAFQESIYHSSPV